MIIKSLVVVVVVVVVVDRNRYKKQPQYVMWDILQAPKFQS